MAYLVKTGDTLSQIAAANNTDVATLQKLNPSITDPNKIFAGQSLTLPTAQPLVASQGTPVTAPFATSGTSPDVAALLKKGNDLLASLPPVSQNGTVNAPENNNVPTPPLPTPSSNGSTYTNSIQAQADAARAALDAERNKQLADIQAQKDAAQVALDETRRLQQEGITAQGDIAAAEKQAKLDELQTEKARFDENYLKVQGLITQLTDLTTTGNQQIQAINTLTIPEVFRSARANSVAAEVAAKAGVLQAGISAYSGQMTMAQNQLTLATNVITSAYKDQLDYYTTLNNFYESKAKDTNQKLVTLTATERAYLSDKINSLKTDLETAQANADSIKKAMLNPDTAQAYAQAGVTLNDTPEVIAKKLGDYAYSQELSKDSKDMATKGYTAVIPGQSAPSGAETFSITDSKGVVHTWYKPVAAGSTTYVPGANPAVDAWVQGINSGRYKPSDVPKDLKNLVAQGLAATPENKQATDLQKNALTSAQDLMDKLKAGSGTSAVGFSRLFTLGYAIPGTAAADFKIQFENLKNLLSLESVKYLKGQGQISDAERQLLASASSKLDLNQSQGEFKRSLDDIITVLNKAVGIGAHPPAAPGATSGPETTPSGITPQNDTLGLFTTSTTPK